MKFNLVIPASITQKKVIFAGISLEESIVFVGGAYSLIRLFSNIYILKLKIVLIIVGILYILFLMIPSLNVKRRNAEVLLKYLEFQVRKMKEKND